MVSVPLPLHVFNPVHDADVLAVVQLLRSDFVNVVHHFGGVFGGAFGSVRWVQLDLRVL